MKKKICITIGIILGLIGVVYHIIWFINYSMYDQYVDGLEEIVENRSYASHENGYYYNVKYPSYPTMTGNLCVATDDDKYALIIWPSLFGEMEYGVQILENGLLNSIMIEEVDTYDVEYREMVDNSRENIEDLFEKANKKWEIQPLSDW